MKSRYLEVIAGAVSLGIVLVLGIVAHSISSDLPDQQAAMRWSDNGNVSQISCYFAEGSQMTPEIFENFRHSLDSLLQQESITVESENPGARLWVDCYSAEGSVILSGSRNQMTVDAMGVGGDFFLFHPFQLMAGAYFSGNDLMQDYCVLDETAAWQLFGSNNIAGQTVNIGGVPHVVSGVISHPKGRLYEAAGLTESRIYLSYESLVKYGESRGINHYEILMPDPVDGYAMEKVKTGLNMHDREAEYIENNKRFSFQNIYHVIKSVGTRSMSGKAIIFPFWENVARGCEDMVALCLLGMALGLVYPVVFSVYGFIRWKKRNAVTLKGVLRRVYKKGAGCLKCIWARIKAHMRRKMAEEDMEEVSDEEMDE
ncbi:MAG: ABC transporter permease [Lachnospiraceae bacterium]|nr:ABC transporter permease [Lachnospiraceae bacterium]